MKVITVLFITLFTTIAAFSQNTGSAAKSSLTLRKIAQVVSDSFGAPVETVEEFMREALEMEKSEKVPATAFIGLAILESAGFNSYLYKKAKNPFGMKATSIWKGETFTMWHEGKLTKFRKYSTVKEAVRDFAKFLNSRKWFKDALACPSKDYECFLEGMKADTSKKEPGYARDPEWADKIKRVILKYNLDKMKLDK